jgi:cytochrome b involved in lipid metabolism
LDPCLELVHRAGHRARWNPLQKLVALPLRRMYLHADTPQHRIERAVRRELSDLSARASRALHGLALDETSTRAPEGALSALKRGEAEGFFPRRELEGAAAQLNGSLREALKLWIDKHQRLERRLEWLLNPESTRRQLKHLDPVEDADRLWCFVRYEFRPEILYCAWGNSIERIAQFESSSTFFHATGTAEGTPVKRTEDTLVHYYYFFNWGLDSYHGRKSIESMERIHGHYYIHNDGMKYVLLNGTFTVLDSLAEIGHRPLREQERLGYFHAQIVMGQAMRIQELSHSWDEMYSWFHSMNRANAGYAPQKLRMWYALEDNFDRDAGVPRPVSQFRKLLERESMGESYRCALGFERPSRTKVRLARIVVRGFVGARALLPREEPYIESLQNYITYPNGVDIEESGEKARSTKLPSACPFSGKVLPEKSVTPEGNLLPLMSVGDAPATELRTISWEEVRRHDTEDDLWVVFGGHVYDVSSFAKNHPGGLEVLLNGAGKDMTRGFENAHHSELTKVFTLNFRIGRIEPELPVSPRLPETRAEARVE